MEIILATIYDIARVSNVSKSTVSRVLNNQSNISEESRQRVMEAIAALDYQPSKLARALTSSGFDAILVLFSRPSKTTVGNPYFSEMLTIITERAEHENFDVIIQTAKNTDEYEKKCIEKIENKMVKGLLLLSSPTDEKILTTLDKYQIPIVVIGNITGHYRHVYSVDTDNKMDSFTLCKSLIDHGHRRIACLHAPLNYHVSLDRVSGYKKAMLTAKLTVDSQLVIDCGFTAEEAYQATKDIMASPIRPTAIFATDAIKAMGIYRALKELDLGIPEDISVIGYNDEHIEPLLHPLMNGITIPVRNLGEVGANIMFDHIFGRASAAPYIQVKTIVNERDSVKRLI
ncbi:LacI family DNA-binding transcriptional regulator [Aeromonas allosaccharophila]|uniref:LacI family DNA-binding transcriptional regulator n=1 Tax=Aeromonas allosaccharophila TaxID=656 RepID=UPI0038D22F84